MTDSLTHSELTLMSRHAGREPTSHSSTVALHVTVRNTAKRKNVTDNSRSVMFLRQNALV